MGVAAGRAHGDQDGEGRQDGREPRDNLKMIVLCVLIQFNLASYYMKPFLSFFNANH